MEKRAQRLILDILKDAAAGGVSKEYMKTILTTLGFKVEIIKGSAIDSLIDKLKLLLFPGDFTPYPKPDYHERSVDGLYKMSLFISRLLFLETGSLSKFSSFKVFEKGIWRACNAFVRDGGEWRGDNNITNIIAAGFALHFQTCATLMDPASPCQSSLVPSMRRVEGPNWFNRMYGLEVCNKDLTIEVIQDWCNNDEITTFAAKENRHHYVPTDATKVTLKISCQPDKSVTEGYVYSTVPEECVIKWSETSHQRLGDFEPILLGNTVNGKVFQSDVSLHLKLQRIIGKENGDCDQMYAILYNAIQLATHWYLNQPYKEGHPEHLRWDKCFTEIMKEIMVVTCDRVVYYTCMGLKISCTYTGSGDGTVHVYEPYKKDLTDEERETRKIDLSKRKLESEVENSINFLSSQNNLLSTVLICGITSIRYHDDTVPAGYIPFPNNCYSLFKEFVRCKKNRLNIVSECVLYIKDAITIKPVDITIIRSLVATVALAIIITNVAVNASNVLKMVRTFAAVTARFGFDAAFDAAFNKPNVRDALDCVGITKLDIHIAPNTGYITSTATNVATDIDELLADLTNRELYFKFLTKLNDYILKDENNKCVSTTQEESKYKGSGYLNVYKLNKSSIPDVVFTAWKNSDQALSRPMTRVREISLKSSGGQGGGGVSKKIIQTGGTKEIVNIIIEAALEVNLNNETIVTEFFSEGLEIFPENEPLIEQIINTQINPYILRYYLSNLGEYRLKRIDDLKSEIEKLEAKVSPSAVSPSPAFGARHRPAAAAPTPAQEDLDMLVLLKLELNEHIMRNSKEEVMKDRFKNGIPDEDKEYYWETRRDLIVGIHSNGGINLHLLSIIENTVLEISDIEMLLSVYAGIANLISPRGNLIGIDMFNSVVRDLNPMLLELLGQSTPQPLTWLESSKNKELGQIIVNFTQARKQFYPPPPPAHPPLAFPPPPPPPPHPHLISLTNLLLYGETSDPNVNIDDNNRILVLFMLHLLLNEVIMDMIPDSFGKSLKIDRDIITLLQQSYILSNSPDPSNHTPEQIEEAKHMPKVMSVSQQRQQVGVVAHASDSPSVVEQGWARGTIFPDDEFPYSIPSLSPAQGETHRGNVVTRRHLFQPQSRKDKFIEFLRDKKIPSAAIDMITPVTIDDSEFDNIDQLASKIERIHNDLMRASGSNIDEQLTKHNIEYIHGLLIQFMKSRFESSASSPPSPPSASSASPAPTTDPTRVCFGCPKATPTSQAGVTAAAAVASSDDLVPRGMVSPALPWVGTRLMKRKIAAAHKRDRSQLEGGSTTSTHRRRKLHRIYRRTQYTNKHKRSIKNTKHNTIKHRKSYRKHNRTIKRRKNSRRHQ
jgi:hypothetical protein